MLSKQDWYHTFDNDIELAVACQTTDNSIKVLVSHSGAFKANYCESILDYSIGNEEVGEYLRSWAAEKHGVAVDLENGLILKYVPRSLVALENGEVIISDTDEVIFQYGDLSEGAKRPKVLAKMLKLLNLDHLFLVDSDGNIKQIDFWEAA